jgi:mandelamide amidase
VDRTREKGGRLPVLAGLPILVKDNIDTVGFPTSAGTAALRRHFPSRNAYVVECLLKQGVIVMGKANMHELAAGGTSSNPTFGFVRNPYNHNCTPGGSSGGSAAAIAARIVPAALGTDTAGSVRIPAAYCGVVGFRPSTYPRRQYSGHGVVPLSLSFDTIGPMGRSVADVCLLHTTIAGEFSKHSVQLENTRIGVPIGAYWDDVDPEVERVARAALTTLRDNGAVLVEVALSEIYETAQHMYSGLGSTLIPDLKNFLRTNVPPVSLRELVEHITSRDVRAWMEGTIAGVEGEGESDPDLLNARGEARSALCKAYRTVFRQHGIQAIVFPTGVFPPPPIRDGGDDPDEVIELNGRMVSKVMTTFRNTRPTVVLGAPGLSLPAGFTSNGLPIGLEFDGLPGDDGALLAFGRVAEAVIGRLPAPPLVVDDVATGLQ